MRPLEITQMGLLGRIGAPFGCFYRMRTSNFADMRRASHLNFLIGVCSFVLLTAGVQPMLLYKELKRFNVFCAALALCFCSALAADEPLRSETGLALGGTESGSQVIARRAGTGSQYMDFFGSSVSKDGQFLAFVDWTTGDLAVRNLLTGKNSRVTDKGPFYKVTEYAESFMRFSDDGKQLAHIWDKNGYELRVINVDGSGWRIIYRDDPEHGEMLRAYDWSADGKYVAAIVPKPGSSAKDHKLQIALIHVADGFVQELKAWSGTVPNEQRMSFSPDGRFLAYDFPVNDEPQNNRISVLRISDRKDVSAVTHPANDRLLDWSPDGSAILFTSDRAGSKGVWLQPVDDGAPQGASVLVMHEIQDDIQPLGFTRDGDYYYSTLDADQRRIFTTSLDLEFGLVSDPPIQLPQNSGFNEGPEWSPDGKFLAYIRNGKNIVVRTIETGAEHSFVPETMRGIWTVGGAERYLRWSPDGRQLIAPQDKVLYLVDVKTGKVIPMVTGRRSRFGRWSPDGKEIFYVRQTGLNDGKVQIVSMNLETEHQEVLYISKMQAEYVSSLELSPDGLWLAFSDQVLAQSSDDVETVLTVMPAQGGQPRLLLRTPGSEIVNVVGWTPNAREVLFTRNHKLAANPSTTLWRTGIDGGEPGKIELGFNVLNSIRFHPDGKRVAFDSGRRGTQIWVMEDVLSALDKSK